VRGTKIPGLTVSFGLAQEYNQVRDGLGSVDVDSKDKVGFELC